MRTLAYVSRLSGTRVCELRTGGTRTELAGFRQPPPSACDVSTVKPARVNKGTVQSHTPKLRHERLCIDVGGVYIKDLAVQLVGLQLFWTCLASSIPHLVKMPFRPLNLTQSQGTCVRVSCHRMGQRAVQST